MRDSTARPRWPSTVAAHRAGADLSRPSFFYISGIQRGRAADV